MCQSCSTRQVDKLNIFGSWKLLSDQWEISEWSGVGKHDLNLEKLNFPCKAATWATT